MPIYDFRCGNCGKVSEVFVHGVDGSPVRCPACGGDDMEKLFSASFTMTRRASTDNTTCCGRTERCETPPCSTDDGCCRR
jgi:putative FmdB family regulatory protein